jgi:NADH:ubiquinone oxidoreductase subunit E
LFSQASHNSRTTTTVAGAESSQIASRVQELISDLRVDNVDMLAACHRIQHEYGYVPAEAVALLAAKFNTTPALVYGAIDFYSELRTARPGEDVVEWCSGPACLLKGSMGIRRAIEAVLGCGISQQTADGKFELRLVQCDGTCHLAPLLRHKGRSIGPLTASSAIEWARALKGVEPPFANPSAPDEDELPSQDDDPQTESTVEGT